MKFSIRKFHHRDSEELWMLHVLTVLDAGFSQEVAEWDSDLRAVEENYTAKGGCLLVAANDNGKLVAMGGYVPTDSFSVELKRMRVHPNFQNGGIGKAVLMTLEAEAKRSGFSRAHLDTANAKARAFYERNGYHLVKSESGGGFEFYFFEKSLCLA